MLWWIWVILGFFLLALEMFMPSGFFLFFIGASAVCTGLITFLGVLPLPWLQWVVCAVIAVVLLLFVRKKLTGHLSGAFPQMGGGDREVLVGDEIPPGGLGQGEMRGSAWQVRNIGSQPLLANTRYAVESIEGLTLKVRRS